MNRSANSEKIAINRQFEKTVTKAREFGNFSHSGLDLRAAHVQAHQAMVAAQKK
jgi:hypothetical protein